MANRERPIRVLMAKAGLDAHERGFLVVSMGLKNEGMAPDDDRSHRHVVVLETWRTAQQTADDCESGERC